MGVGSDYLKLLKQRGQNLQDELTARSRADQQSVTGGYYRQPELWTDTEKLYQKVKGLEGELSQKKETLTSMENGLKDSREALTFLEGHLSRLSESYKTAPSQSIADQYAKAYARYEQLRQKHSNGYLDYLAASDDYNASYASYEAATKGYQDYLAGQQEQLDTWRSFIRDASKVKNDLDAVNAEIEALKKQEADPWYEQAAEFIGLKDGETSDAMRALEHKRDLLQEEYDWSRHYQYADLMNAADFAEKSKYVPTAKGKGRSNLDIMLGNYSTENSGWEDPLYEYINGNEEAGAYIANKAAAAYGDDNALGALFGRSSESETRSQQMSKDEVAIFNYLYATQGKDAAHGYYEYLQSDLNSRQRINQEAYWSEYAREHPVASSLFSVMTSPMKGLSYLGQAADYLPDRKLEKDVAYNKFSYVNSAIRNEVSREIQSSGKWGNVGSFAYQTAMSMGDFLLNSALGGGNKALVMSIMGTGAAADATLAAKDRGLNDDQAFALGTVAGLAEAITEKYSLDALLDSTSLGKSVAGYIAKNMLAEGSEEGASSLINLFSDILISKDKSQWSESVEAYQAQGYNEAEAFGKAFADQAASIGLDILGGALSGGIMAGGSAGIQTVGNRLHQNHKTTNTQEKPPATFQEEVERQMAEKLSGEKTAQNGAAGSVSLDNPQVDIDDATWEQGQRLAQAMGRNIVFYSKDDGRNGFFEIDTGDIHVNLKSGDPLAQIFSHELTHSVEMAEVYKDLSDTIMQRIAKNGGDLEQIRQAKYDAYTRNGVKLSSREAIDSEIVAEYVQKHLLTDEQSILSLTQQNRSLSQRIKAWIDNVLAKLGNKNAQERAFLLRARNLYSKALQQTQGSFTKETSGVESVQVNNTEVVAENSDPDADDGGIAETREWAEQAYANGKITADEYDETMDELDRAESERLGVSTRQYSISEIDGQKENYGQGVILDTDIFDGVKPRAWGEVLSAYVYNNLAGTELTVYDENGDSETIYLAKATDRVRKDGAKNAHKVIDKLARYTGDNIKALATVHLSELLETSKYEKSTGEHTHQWMDENGWERRKTYIEDRRGHIYEATLNIAKGRDRNILYAISNVKQIDKRAARGEVSSTVAGRDSLTKSNSFGESLPQGEDKVKRQYSVSGDAVSKKDVAKDLREILRKGGSAADLRQYVAQMERSGGKAEQKGVSAEQTRYEAEQIIRNAKRRGISVEEYLQQNWEQYDQDGQWNEDARKALDMEKSGRKYSVSDGAEVETAKEESDIRSTLPKKAQDYLKRAERNLLWKIGDALSVPKLARREYLEPIIQELSNEYLKEGTIQQEKMDLLFEKAYSEGVIVDAEFYNQFKHIKDHLRSLSVTISERDQADIADFKNFRRRAFGTLRIVNEGGLPVDTAYQELHSMEPSLFPEDITHPADQLIRMYDAARSIQVTEKTVQDYYGKYEPEYRRWAKADFETAVGEVLGELQTVKRYADDRMAKDSEKAAVTAEEAMEAYKQLKAARRTYERMAAKNLLTAHDEMQVGRLLKHEIELDHLDPEKDNVKGITAVYEAKQEYERLCKLIREYKQHVHGKLRAKADQYLKTANDWKDKKIGVLYARETMRRNIYDIVPDRKLAREILEEYFEPVHRAEAQSNRFKTKYRDRVRTLNLSTKAAKGNLVSEAHAVQLLGEAEDNIRMLENVRGRIKNRDGKNLSEWQAVVDKLWAENPNLDKEKIQNAVKEFRKIYDELFQQMNQVRVANGYEPVNYRNGYFPHFQPGDSDSILAQFGKALGIDTQVDALPTTINGLTHTFKPGIQWFGNAQERLGFNTAYDAVEGFDKYIEGVASVIHHTQNIQNLRAFAAQIRYRTSEEGIRKQVDEIYERPGLSEEEKQVMIAEIYAHGKFALSNFVTELDEYTNLLANKKSKYDRTVEAMIGRRAYTIMKAWEARVGANMIAGNLTSALTNFIPLTQAGAQMDRFSLLQGMWGTLQAYRSDDGIVGMSSFLTNRRGSDPLVKTWQQQRPGFMEIVIESNIPSVLESKTYHKIKKVTSAVRAPVRTAVGKSSELAGWLMETIDGFVSGSIVRGSYYQNIKRGLSEAEAMNQADIFASNVMADRSKGAMPTLMQSTNPLFKLFTQFQLEVNNQFSEVFKDLPRGFKEKGLKALVWVLIKYFVGAFLYNEVYEALIGRRPALDPIGILCEAVQDTHEKGIGEAGANLAVNLLEQLPFSAGLTLVGIETDGGRIPASSAVPDLTALWDAATTEGWSAEKRWKEIQDELNKLAYVIPPFGGNQVSKLWKGVKAYIEGGSYNVDAGGNDILQYPVYKDSPEDAFWNLVRASFLGKSSLPEAQDWVDSEFDSLGAKQTAAYQDMLEAGVKDRNAYGLLRDIQNAQDTEEKKKDAAQRDILRSSDVSSKGKAIVYYGLMATEKERGIMDQLTDLGADPGAITDVLMEMRDANTLKGGAANAAKYEAISKAVLTDEEKAVLVGSIMGTEMLTESGELTQYAKFDYAIKNGMSVDQFIAYRNTGADIDKYLELRDAGHSVEDAMDAGIALEELKNSVEDPTTVQKWRTVIDSTDDVEKQLISLSIVMTDSQYRKVQAAHDFGVAPSTYVRINEMLPKYDVNGNGSYTQAEITEAINAMGGTSKLKAILWQLVTGSKSAKGNPYSTAVGQQVIDALEALKANESTHGLSFEEEIMRQLMGG